MTQDTALKANIPVEDKPAGNRCVYRRAMCLDRYFRCKEIVCRNTKDTILQ